MFVTAIRLVLVSLLPILFSLMFYVLQRKTAFGKLKNIYQQIIIGVVFGGLAILGTEYGITLSFSNGDSATVNVRDAAPISAALIFGAPAGIIAGVLGGVERWLSVFWGVGAYTRVACSVATIVAGVFSAGMRVWLFDNKKPAWGHGLALGLTIEVLHMLLVFLTNMDGIAKAFEVVRACAPWMIVLNSLSVAGSLIAISIVGKEPRKRQSDKEKIAQTFQRGLLVCVILAFIITSVFTFVLQTKLAVKEAEDLMCLNVEDVRTEIDRASDESLLSITRKITSRIKQSGGDHETLTALAKEYCVAEINVVDNDGIITSSTEPKYVGFDMKSGEQSKEFMQLLNGRVSSFAQEFQPTTYSENTSMKYAGVAIRGKGFVQVGYNAAYFRLDIADRVRGLTANRHIGRRGYMIIALSDSGTVVSGRDGGAGDTLAGLGLNIDKEKMPEGVRKTAEIYGEKCEWLYEETEGYYIIAVLPYDEVYFSRDISSYMLVFMEILVFAVLFIQVYFLIKKIVVDNLLKVNSALSQITGGNLNTTVDVRSSEEFASLSDDINTTVDTLKEYIAEASARIDKELEFAKSIQLSALPSVFPPFPDHTEFDIFASMDTAKEVGGDFYDFYMLGNDHLVILIADVSGKGIPASLFMMTAKTLIKSLMESGMSVEDAFANANEELCASNEAGMFVTAWMGLLDLHSGNLSFANAGHNPPLLRHRSGEYEYLRTKANFVLAGMDGAKYRRNELTLLPGDEIFLYTDGATEATNASEELYGEDRLVEYLNSKEFSGPEDICHGVKADIDKFVGEADQFDDITMLSLRTNYFMADNKITLYPDMGSVAKVAEFAETYMEKNMIPMALSAKLMVAIDEIYSNIARYSGATSASVDFKEDENDMLTLTFTDNGKQYDPTKNEDPDVTMSAEERQIGGLGIFMVKKMSNSVIYENTDGNNILKVVFDISKFKKKD